MGNRNVKTPKHLSFVQIIKPQLALAWCIQIVCARSSCCIGVSQLHSMPNPIWASHSTVCRSVSQCKLSTEMWLLSVQICGKQYSHCSVSWEEETKRCESWEEKVLLRTTFGSVTFWCVSLWFALLYHLNRVKRKCGRNKRPCRKYPLTSSWILPLWLGVQK